MIAQEKRNRHRGGGRKRLFLGALKRSHHLLQPSKLAGLKVGQEKNNEIPSFPVRGDKGEKSASHPTKNNNNNKQKIKICFPVSSSVIVISVLWCMF